MAASAAALAPASVPAPASPELPSRPTGSTTPTPPAKPIQASDSRAFHHGQFFALQHLPPHERVVFDNIARSIPDAADSDDATLHAVAREVALTLYRLDNIRRLEFSTYTERMRAICEAENKQPPTDVAELGILKARIFREDALGPGIFSKLHTQERFYLRCLKDLDAQRVHILQHRQRNKTSELKPEVQALLDAAHAPADPMYDLLASFSESALNPPEVSAPATSSPARSALCPCGSGRKYKRCCGKNAPPHLHPAV